MKINKSQRIERNILAVDYWDLPLSFSVSREDIFATLATLFYTSFFISISRLGCVQHNWDLSCL